MGYDYPDFEASLGLLILIVITIIVSTAIATVGYFTGISFLKWIGGIGILGSIAVTIWYW